MTVSQARGAVLLICQSHRIPILEFTPLQIKSFICGYGKAEKKQVQFVVQKTFKLKSAPKPDDAADALGDCPVRRALLLQRACVLRHRHQVLCRIWSVYELSPNMLTAR